MALNSRKVRLPELPIFRKFSLALRQEFARAEDVLEALEESSRQIKAFTEEGGQRPGRAIERAPQSKPLRAPFTEAPAEDELEESPESFLKDSVVDSLPQPRIDGAAGRSTADSTVAMEALPDAEDRASSRPKRRSPPEQASLDKKEPAGAAEDERRPATKRIPRKPAGSRQARKRARPVSPSSSGEAEPAPSEDSHAEPAAGSGSPDPAQRRPGKADRAPKEPPGGDSSKDVEREFWGEERPWGKGRKRNVDKGRPGRIGIIRIGAEGRPVGDEERAAREGE